MSLFDNGTPSQITYWVRKPPQGFSYGDEYWDYGQVVHLQGAPNDPLLVDLHYVLPVDPSARLVACGVCGARFIQERWCVAHGDKRHGSAELALHPLQSASPPVPPRTKGGRPRLSAKEIASYQTTLRKVVLEYVDKYDDGDDPVPTISRVRQFWPGKMTEKIWRLRYQRTLEDWHCKNWNEIFYYIRNTRT